VCRIIRSDGQIHNHWALVSGHIPHRSSLACGVGVLASNQLEIDLEATGGYERAVVAALAMAGLPAVVANPRQVRDFAKATGQLAKTDDVDADLLALFADRVRPTPRPLPDAVVQQLDALMTRRRQLLDMLTAERNRLEHAVGPIRRSLVDHIRWLERRVTAVDRDLDDTIARSPVWRAMRQGPVYRLTWRLAPPLGPRPGPLPGMSPLETSLTHSEPLPL
jgi:transposase